jgi:ubiquinone/menaquinone biosynthesis C-methylase UbiE
VSIAFEGDIAAGEFEGRRALAATLVVTAPVVFVPRVRLRIQAGEGQTTADSGHSQYLGWLPRGRYAVRAFLPDALPAGPCTVSLEAAHHAAMKDVTVAEKGARLKLGAPTGGAAAVTWDFQGIAPTPRLAELSWHKAGGDWFFRHFDHAGPTIMSYLLGDAPQLRGHILDVGCGDGITDLSLALRTGCEELIGIDPFRGFDRLAEIARAAHLPADAIPPNLRFMAEDANALPFADSSFDVLISWGSVEHIAGGYLKALDEMRRVLKPGGLLFIHPGLYYSNLGHHLGEFSSEPFFHLKKPLAEIERMVMTTPPNYMDRSGEFSTPAQYWQWFRELNPITVTQFERELRERDLQPWRVAIRTEGLIEYTPEIEKYPMQDLATAELYVSCVNRKG